MDELFVLVSAYLLGFFVVVYFYFSTREKSFIGRVVKHVSGFFGMFSGSEEEGGGWRWRCPNCGKVMHESVAHQHVLSHQEEEEEEEDGSVFVEKGSVKGELLDDYELDREKEEKEESILNKELSSKDRDLERVRLKAFWAEELFELERRGKVSWGKNEHKGSLRGADIMLKFLQDFKRLDEDYDVEKSRSHGKLEVWRVD